MQFSLLYNQGQSIIRTEHFKFFRHGINDALICYLKKSEKFLTYNEIFKYFSSKYDFDYKNYQFFKIFYLSSENSFSNEYTVKVVLEPPPPSRERSIFLGGGDYISTPIL